MLPTIIKFRFANFRMALTVCICGVMVSFEAAFAQLNVVLIKTRQEVQTFMGTDKVKIVFVNGNAAGNASYIYYIDYSEATPAIKKMANTAGASLPVIAPNGSGVAFAKGVRDDGLLPSTTTKGSAYFSEISETAQPVLVASDTAFVPRFVQNAATPTILYSTCMLYRSATQYPFDGCGMVKKRALTLSGATWTVGAEQTVYSGGSYYGGMSYNGRYLATGWLAGPGAFLLDSQNGPTPVRVQGLHLKNRTTNADTFIVNTGACNPSVSASRRFPNCMLYFDFGSPPGFTDPVVGMWGVHQVLFISRIDQEPLKAYKVMNVINERPILSKADFDSLSIANAKGQAFNLEWDNPEWSNHPYYAVAALRVFRTWNDAGAWGQSEKNERIYLINLKTGAYLPIMQASDTSRGSSISLSWPWVWVDTGAGFKEDSTWLSNTIYPAAGVTNHITPSSLPEKMHLQGNEIISARPMRSVTVHTALGDDISTSALRNAKTAVLPAMPAGIYFITAEMIDGSKSVVRWILPK
jgi:hypothetical protein